MITKTDVLEIYVEYIPISFVIASNISNICKSFKIEVPKDLVNNFVENVHRPRKNLLSDVDDEIHKPMIWKRRQQSNKNVT